MIIARVNRIYFSPTGGTEEVVKLIGAAWEQPQTEIDLTEREKNFSGYHFAKDELCIIGVPAYGGRVPEAALERLSMMRAEGSPAVLAASYGNRAIDDTLMELADALEKRGFVCAAAISAVTEHSIVRKFGAGRPDEADRAELAGFAEKIRERLLNAEEPGRVGVPGNRPYRERGSLPVKPQASRKCTSCGLCAKKCPVGAIPEENPGKTDKKKCISCMRCIGICPNGARGCSPVVMFGAEKKLEKLCGGRRGNQLFLERLI